MSITVTTSIQNMAGNNAKGLATGRKRAKAYIEARRRLPVDTCCFQETTVASQIRPTFDKGLPNMSRAGGSKGRYIYLSKNLKRIAGGTIHPVKSSWYRNSDKPAAWLIFEKQGTRGMDVSVHLEYRTTAEASNKRVQQIRSIAKQAFKIAEDYDVLPQNIMFCGDFNSTHRVMEELASLGYPNSAKGTKYERTSTFIGWDGKSRRRVDYACAQNAVMEHIAQNKNLSDHAGLRVRRTLVSKTDVNGSIRDLQNELNALGFLVGKADGIIGPRTRGGTRRFQQSWNLGTALLVDGIAGDKTWEALRDTKANNGRISPHFRAKEFQCKCGGRYSDCLGVLVFRNDIIALERLRANAYSGGLIIVSAYRCPSHNRKVGGATSSQHLAGKAFDIPARVSVTSALIPERFRGRGYQGSNRLVRHVDSRPNKATWAY